MPRLRVPLFWRNGAASEVRAVEPATSRPAAVTVRRVRAARRVTVWVGMVSSGEGPTSSPLSIAMERGSGTGDGRDSGDAGAQVRADAVDDGDHHDQHDHVGRQVVVL